MALAEEQINAAFDQSEKEVLDLHSRISQGLREAKKNGVKIGLPQGTSLTTKKALECYQTLWVFEEFILQIQKRNKEFIMQLSLPIAY